MEDLIMSKTKTIDTSSYWKWVLYEYYYLFSYLNIKYPRYFKMANAINFNN